MNVWWLTQKDCEMINKNLERLELPQYIADNVRSMLFQPLRGRLWGWGEVVWDDSKPLAALAGEMGGIVIRDADVPKVINLPGFITDMELNKWSE